MIIFFSIAITALVTSILDNSTTEGFKHEKIR
jgi:hypothetical protein